MKIEDKKNRRSGEEAGGFRVDPVRGHKGIEMAICPVMNIAPLEPLCISPVSG
jgi:hypothetical protein